MTGKIIEGDFQGLVQLTIRDFSLQGIRFVCSVIFYLETLCCGNKKDWSKQKMPELFISLSRLKGEFDFEWSTLV